MSTPADPDICAVRWCHEVVGHDGPHRGIEFDVLGLDVSTARPVVVQAVRQGESTRVQACVLVTGECETALTWPQVLRMSIVLDHMYRSQPNLGTRS